MVCCFVWGGVLFLMRDLTTWERLEVWESVGDEMVRELDELYGENPLVLPLVIWTCPWTTGWFKNGRCSSSGLLEGARSLVCLYIVPFVPRSILGSSL